jgi:hypothetical protein
LIPPSMQDVSAFVKALAAYRTLEIPGFAANARAPPRPKRVPPLTTMGEGRVGLGSECPETTSAAVGGRPDILAATRSERAIGERDVGHQGYFEDEDQDQQQDTHSRSPEFTRFFYHRSCMQRCEVRHRASRNPWVSFSPALSSAGPPRIRLAPPLRRGFFLVRSRAASRGTERWGGGRTGVKSRRQQRPMSRVVGLLTQASAMFAQTPCSGLQRWIWSA